MFKFKKSICHDAYSTPPMPVSLCVFRFSSASSQRSELPNQSFRQSVVFQSSDPVTMLGKPIPHYRVGKRGDAYECAQM